MDETQLQISDYIKAFYPWLNNDYGYGLIHKLWIEDQIGLFGLENACQRAQAALMETLQQSKYSKKQHIELEMETVD